MPVVPLDVILDLDAGREKRTTDYRSVPRSDTGETYVDQGYLGWYSPSEEPFPMPSDVRTFAGFGATDADLRRGYSEPRISNNPAYDLSNYKDRYSEPGVSDVQKGDVEAAPSDLEFRGRNRQARGFITRSRLPKDR